MIEYRIDTLEATVSRISTAVESIDKSLQILATLETKHAETREGLSRCFKVMEENHGDHETRIRVIESEIPTMRLVRNWVIAGVIGLSVLAGTMVFERVIAGAQAQTK